MSVASLKDAIARRSFEMLPPLLVREGTAQHKRGWRDCPCSWCAMKREATVVIGSHVPRYMTGVYIDDIRHIWREDKRTEYRAKMKELEE